jgi:D-alanyl-D-alanine carboxypeptidase
MPGQNVWLGTSGISHDDVPISPNMMFSIASVTKMFTAACILQLAEEGKLSLDDSLSQWLPEFPNINRTITIRQLLNHTSGVFDYYWHPDFEDSFRSDLTRRWTPEETLSMVLEPYFPPGTDFRYSNTGYILLGMIIRAATGNKVSTEFRKRFLDPLELTQTFFYVEETISGEMAHGWYDFDGDGFIDDMTTYPLTSYYSIEWTAGAMVSTPKDMVQWASALFEGELLSKTSLDQMLMFDPFSGEGRASNEYGLGVRRFNPTIAHGEECIGHSGEVIGYRNIIAYLTGKRVSVSVMINNMRAESLWGTVEALITVVLDNID